MTVQDTITTVTVPQQAGPTEPPVAAPPPAPLVGRDRPLTVDERAFAIGLTALVLVLGTIIVVGLLVGQYVWT
jgi:hypothetical protein